MQFGKSILVIFLLILAVSLYCKELNNNSTLDKYWLYKKSNVYLTFHPTISPKPNITSLNNPYNHQIKLGGIMGTNFGFIYNYNFNTKYGIAAGFYQSGLSFRTLNYDYGLQDSIYTALKTIPDYCFKCRIFVMHANTFPIRFIYRKELNRKIDINMQVGLDIQLQPSFYYRNQILGVEIGNDSSYFDMFIIKLENKGTKNFNVVPYFGFSIGINQFLKNNKHYLNYQFSGHIPFYNPYTNGSFNILPNTQYQATGTFKLNPMSFGLEVNYVFTFRKRKLRKGI